MRQGHSEEILRRLQALKAGDPADGDAAVAARLERLFRQRARRLAAPRRDLAEQSGGEAVLSFRIGGERYGVGLRDLAEVLPLDKWVRVPGMPGSLLGVMNLRGEIRPVLNLHLLLLGADAPPSPGSLVLFLRGAGQEVGLRIDALGEIITVETASLTLPGEGAALLGRYVKGMAANDVILLDIAQLLALDLFRDLVAENSRTP